MPTSSSPKPAELRKRLEQALSPAHLTLLHRVTEEASLRLLPLYLVGGFVRDLLLDRPGLDLDLVVEGDAIGLAHSLAGKYGGKVTAHTRFGTAVWILDINAFARLNAPAARVDMHTLDFISARSETYKHPGALPTVRPGALSDDLRRRDFTINTLALRLDGSHFGELHDEWNGLGDLRQGVVRVLHPGSYTDDPTRILRAIRYEQRYGFQIASADLEMIAQAKSLLGGLSGERLRHELDLVLAEGKAAEMLARLAELDILGEIHPALAWDDSLRPRLERLDQPEPISWRGVPDLRLVPRRVALGYLLWLGCIAVPDIESLASRLDFSAPLRDALLSFSALHNDLPALAGARPSVLTARLDEVPLLAVCALSLESVPIRESVTKSVYESVEDYLSLWRHIHPKTTGHTLQRRGLPPGPAYQRILRRLREAWLDGEVSSAKEEEALLGQLIKKL